MRELSYKKIVQAIDSTEVSRLPSSLNGSLILEGVASLPITEPTGNILFGPVIDVNSYPLYYNHKIHGVNDYVPETGLFLLNKKAIAAPDILWYEIENVVFYKINGISTASTTLKNQAVKVKERIAVGSNLTYEEDLDYYIFPCSLSLTKGDKIILEPDATRQLNLKAPIGRYNVMGDLNIGGQKYTCCRYMDTPELFYKDGAPEDIYQIYYYYVVAGSHEVEFSTSLLKKAVINGEICYTGTIRSTSPIFRVYLDDATNESSAYTINGRTAIVQIHENDYDNVSIRYICSNIEF
jgi:hypothetical protein